MKLNEIRLCKIIDIDKTNEILSATNEESKFGRASPVTKFIYSSLVHFLMGPFF